MKNVILTLMALGPNFPTGPGKPYMQKMEKHKRPKLKQDYFDFLKKV